MTDAHGARRSRTGTPRGARGPGLGMTALVKEELARTGLGPLAECRAEIAAMLRFGGALQLVSGRMVVTADLDRIVTARRLRAGLAGAYGVDSEISAHSGTVHRGGGYTVRVDPGGTDLTRQTGLVDARGRPIRGLPAGLVQGSVEQLRALWRGAFLAHGSMDATGRAIALRVDCPTMEAALALVGAARRLGLPAEAQDLRDTTRVRIREAHAIRSLLDQMGAKHAARTWDQHQAARPARFTAPQRASISDANAQRSARAAAATADRVGRALQVLGDGVPEHLRRAGELRIAHRQASLDELGRLAEPPLSKDAIAGRIRRLLNLADKQPDP